MKRSRNTFKAHPWLLCFVVVSLLGLSQTAAHSASWQPGPPLGTARNQFAGGVIDGKIYVFGGNAYPDGHNLKSTEMLDPSKGKWVYRSPGPFAREELSGAVVNGRLYVFGFSYKNFVTEYDPDTNTWASKSPSPTPGPGAVAVTYNNKIYVFRVVHRPVPLPTPDIVEIYDPEIDKWEKVTDVPKNIANPAVAVVGDKAYVIGGALEGQWNTNIYVYDLITGKWTTNGLPPIPNPRVFAYGSAAPVMDGRIFLIGGIECVSPQDCWTSDKVDIYDTVSNTWQSSTPLPTSIMGHLSVLTNNQIYVIGGNTGNQDPDDDTITSAVWKYSLVNHKPTIGTLVPSSVTSTAGVAQTFTATYNDVDGYSDLKTIDFQISPSGTGANAIWARYSSATNKLNLYNNAGTGFVSGSCTPGTAGTLQNSQGKIMCSATTVTKIKNKIVVKWSIVPKSAFASPTAKKIRMIARDQSNATSGWVSKGNWTIQP